MFGVDINYFLTDAFWVGLQGQYFIKQLTDQDELVGLQYNRIPTLNRYLYGGALNFGYVPVVREVRSVQPRRSCTGRSGRRLASASTFTEIIPRNPANAIAAFKNNALTPNVAIGGRFFLFDWLTVNFAFRDYLVTGQVRAQPIAPLAPDMPYATWIKPRRPTRRWSTTSCSTPASACTCRRSSSTRLPSKGGGP